MNAEHVRHDIRRDALHATPRKSAAAGARSVTTGLCASLALWLASCGYNDVIDQDEDVKGAWAEVQNQYKRRADLVPSLVKVVQGAAKFEQETLKQVVEARASVGQMKIDASVIDDPAKLAQFEAAQAKLSGALSRLLVVSESYPDLKASAAFRDLQAQLEGTENRIAVARGRYIESVAEYNKVVLRFPTSIGAGMRGKKERPTFTGDPGSEKPPEINL
jgi:LemA protein